MYSNIFTDTPKGNPSTNLTFFRRIQMLRNTQNQIVNVPAKFNTQTNPSLFVSLRETKELSDPCGRSTGGMFSISERAKFMQ